MAIGRRISRAGGNDILEASVCITILVKLTTFLVFSVLTTVAFKGTSLSLGSICDIVTCGLFRVGDLSTCTRNTIRSII